jgi:Lon protease-like protein
VKTEIAIPSEAPVMVLPGVALFPNGIVPLRIFEPRYRAMLEWALEHDRMFCIALMKPGISEAVTEDQFFHTAGVGLVSASVTQADGTSNLMLQGLARVRFTGFSQLKPFRIAKLHTVSPIAGDPEEAATLAGEVRDLCVALAGRRVPLPESFLGTLGRISDPEDLADAVAHSLISDPSDRQALLEERDPAARLRTILRLLRGQFPGAA